MAAGATIKAPVATNKARKTIIARFPKMNRNSLTVVLSFPILAGCGKLDLILKGRSPREELGSP